MFALRETCTRTELSAIVYECNHPTALTSGVVVTFGSVWD